MDRPDGIVDFTPDPTLYPFESRWFDSSVGPVHYVDEGDGPVVLLMHGNPDWSFLYRKIITTLGPRVRCVAPDYPGFGLATHPDGYWYTPAEHAEVVLEFLGWMGPASSRRAERQRLTTGQVSVRTMPSTDWIAVRTSCPTASMSSASTSTTTS